MWRYIKGVEHLFYVITKCNFLCAEPRQYSGEGIHLMGSLKELSVQGLIVKEGTAIENDPHLIRSFRMINVKVWKVTHLTK